MVFHDGARTNLDDFDISKTSPLPQMAQATNLLYIPLHVFGPQVLLSRSEISLNLFLTNHLQMVPNRHQSEIGHLVEILYRNQINHNVSYLH